jgi:GT2 family glycosyltransferase
MSDSQHLVPSPSVASTDPTAPGASFWVVVLGFNGTEDTRRCLDSLERSHGGPPNVVYVDNDSTDGAADTIGAVYPWCHVLRSSVNRGYAGGNNLGIRFALLQGAEIVLILNNDTVTAPDLVHELHQAAGLHPDFGIIGPVIGFEDEPSRVRTDGCVFNAAGQNEFFARRAVPLDGPPSVTEVDIVNGCCLLARRSVLEAIGLFDEQFFLVHEESDLCLRAKEAGFKCGVLNRMLVWHKGSSSFKRTGRRLQRYYDVRNLSLLIGRRSSTGAERRSWARSRMAFWRYAYHAFCVEDEAGETLAAFAVLEALDDALFGRFGPYEKRTHRLTPVIKRTFLLMRTMKARAARPTDGAALKADP